MVNANLVRARGARVKLRQQNGFTLIELVLVVVIIGILALVATTGMDDVIDVSRQQAVEEELENLAKAISGDAQLVAGGVRTDYGYVGDVGALPSNLDNLVSNPGGYATWNGPYLRDNFIENTNDFKVDPWNTQYAYSGGVTIQSTGSGSTVTKQIANNTAELLSNPLRGITLDRNGAPPGSAASNVIVTLTYPNGAGGLTSTTLNPSSSGSFTFSGIPVGNHNIQSVYSTMNDTAESIASVAPRVGGYVSNLRFGAPHWSDTSSGGGRGGAAIIYISGTATITGAQSDKVSFNVTNDGDTALTITWLSFVHAVPVAYAQKVLMDGNVLFNDNSDKLAPGDTAWLAPSYLFAAKDTITVSFDKFMNTEGNGGSPTAIPDNTDFSVTFSDGSTISFTAVL